MFANVNEVVQHLHLAEQGAYRFVIDWSASCYREEGRPEDPWNYYFEDCFPGCRGKQTVAFAEENRAYVRREDNVIAPQRESGGIFFLMPAADRRLANRYIERYLILKPHIAAKIDAFVAANFNGFVIGLHVRGPLRRDPDILDRRRRDASEEGVPFDRYFRLVDAALAKHAEARIFACSDSGFVIDRIVARYGARVFVHPSARSALGEMHRSKRTIKGFSPYRLGEDVLVEAYSLARTDLLVHGSSNVSNFVLCKNPALEHRYAYEDADRSRSLA